MEFRFVETGSQEWTAARELRHALFFAPLGLPPSLLDDEDEESAVHLVAMIGDSVVGYGRLNALGEGDYQVSQMVVALQWQGQGIGRQLLDRLVDRARHAGGLTLRLAARSSAAGFYSKAGFQQVGNTFPSAKTGIPHINMVMRL